MGLEKGSNSKTHKVLDNHRLPVPRTDSGFGTLETLDMCCHNSFAEPLLEISANMIFILEMRT